MPTIQIRNVPTEAYEALRRQAKREGKSLQSYMHDQVVEMSRQIRKRDSWDEYRAKLMRNPPPVKITTESILADIDEGRRERFGD